MKWVLKMKKTGSSKFKRTRTNSHLSKNVLAGILWYFSFWSEGFSGMYVTSCVIGAIYL